MEHAVNNAAGMTREDLQLTEKLVAANRFANQLRQASPGSKEHQMVHALAHQFQGKLKRANQIAGRLTKLVTEARERIGI